MKIHRWNIFFAVFAAFFFLECATDNNSDNTADPQTADTGFLFHPRFEKPTERLFGRVSISWNAVENASGYLLQMSYSQDFETIDKSWTVNGLSAEIPLDPELSLWFRIRAFNDSSVSRWSRPLEISQDTL